MTDPNKRPSPMSMPAKRADQAGQQPERSKRATPGGRPSGRPVQPADVPAAGPLGRILRLKLTGKEAPNLAGAQSTSNALTLLRRTAFLSTAQTVCLPVEAVQALTDWAEKCSLGQVSGDVAAVAARRSYALEHLKRQGLAVRRISVTPEWRVAVGLGDRGNAHEIGMALHGSYGWPIIPGSTLKGVAAQWAWEQVDTAAPDEVALFARVFGTPLPKTRAQESREHKEAGRELEPFTAARGSVRFLDALPAGGPVTVTSDVLTPHAKPYYDRSADPRDRAVPPPAEHHQPVPVTFLTVSAGTFAVDLVGNNDTETDRAAEWLRCAAEDIGVGGKTSAGYGYLVATPKGEM